MASSRTFWRERDQNAPAKVKMPFKKKSVFDPNLRCISGVRGVVTYTDGQKRGFGLAWSLLTERIFISAYLMNNLESKTLKEGDWIEAVVVWIDDNWVARSFFCIESPVKTEVVHVGHNVLLEVKTTVVIGAVLAKHAFCYSELFGRVVAHYETPKCAGNKLEWGAVFNATLSKPRDPDDYGCEWTVTKLISRCDKQRPLPLTIRFVHATVGELVNDDSFAMNTDDGDTLVFESFVYTGRGEPKQSDRVEAYVCRDTGDKMRAVGVRPIAKQVSSSPLLALPTATIANGADEDTAQLLDDLEDICSDCSTGDTSSDEKVEPEYSHTSVSLTNQQNMNSLPAESTNGYADEVNLQMMEHNGTSSSQAEESPHTAVQSELRSTPQMSASGCSEGDEQECRAKELLKRVMGCKGVVEMVAKEDALLMRDIFFFDRYQ